MAIITYKDIQKINELYVKYKTYATVARITGYSPATVKKYVQKDYVPKAERQIIRFSGDIPEFDSTMFRGDDWGDLCILSAEEIKEVRELWQELDT